MVKLTGCILLLLIGSVSIAQNSRRSFPDSVVWVASRKYDDPSIFKKILLGTNYRKEWSTPVKLPVFDIKKMGFTIKELGGGQQTKSLQMEDKRGREWVLRTVDKDVEKALPNALRNTLAQKVTQDMISAAHPYAPLTIPVLTKKLEIIAPVPTFYYIPEDEAFGEFKDIFANTVCMLEQREPTPDNSDTESTSKVLDEIKDENDHLVIQRAVLRARLLDMLIADWDRHADQWRWGEWKTANTTYYYAIPRDRDQAYFYSNGLLVKFVRQFALVHLVGYRDNLKKLNKLNFKSWSFDATFINELNREDWEKEIKLVQELLTDETINTAMRRLPPEIYPISGEEMAYKMKGRRDELLKKGLKYYDFISTYVTINGSNEKENFHVTGDRDKLTVTGYQLRRGKEIRKFYERTFDPKETHQITINGLEDDDKFFIEEGAAAKIRVIINGGKGRDEYDIKGKVKHKIIDEDDVKK